MAGSATIGTNLVDTLIDLVDDLRGDLHPDFGVRQWRLYTVLRKWSGSGRGVGVSTDTTTELSPQPKIDWPVFKEGHRQLTPMGMLEDFEIAVSEVSLTYTESELTGGSLENNEEWLFRLSDAHGQQIPDRYFTMGSEIPQPDRIETIGWKFKLRRIDEGLCQ